MIKEFIRTHRKGFFIGLIALGVVLVIMSAIMIGMMLTRSYKVIGPWYNEGLGQQLRFVDEDSVIITTAAGVVEAEYSFDKKTGEGVISINGQGIDFFRKSDSIFLVGENGETEYSKGEMKADSIVTTVSEVTTEVTTEQAVTETTVTTTVFATEPETTAETTAEPVATATPTPTVTPTPTSSPTFPSFSMHYDPFLPLLGNPVEGTWVRLDQPGTYLVFIDDGTVEMYYDYLLYELATYTYDKFSGEGITTMEYAGDVAFTVTGKFLSWDYDYGIYQR